MGALVSELRETLRTYGPKGVPRKLWFWYRQHGLRERIFREYERSNDPEVLAVLDFLSDHPSLEFPVGMKPPYAWTGEFRNEDIAVERDDASGMLFTQVNGNRVFFPRNATIQSVQEAVRVARMEQDARSPHSYVNGDHKPDPGDTAGFIGASDGIFCLSLIDRLSRAYLFEPDSAWHEPLRATTEPWRDKVEIVPLALGDHDGDGIIRLDTFLSQRGGSLNFIQMDVEGHESEVLAGAGSLLRDAKKLRLSICAYHKRLDFPDFEALLGGMGYRINHSPGFYVLGIRMPYFRRGVLYASRTRSS